MKLLDNSQKKKIAILAYAVQIKFSNAKKLPRRKLK